ncbi:ethanolamine permease [Novacetimonas maltaceti]|uniref:Putative amino acid permease YhdG n=1 Tax=Novacetimonas maltaceti TaxID=1203393 RepID=A0A2S3W0J6_9PROT|nr:ethanolamine permease [Novacetimonas maltaceti]POF62390.1 putative amino acid permease YhdG [Novacetimonas maltaceti]PYD59289.1 ethanolamine permease [Novacetimonas maltaceti]
MPASPSPPARPSPTCPSHPPGAHLRRRLGAFHLWGIAVGLVISGEYFGWSYGWATAGTLGFLVTTVMVALMYSALIFSYTELTTSIPRAGGPFAYVLAAYGPVPAFVAGFASIVELVFAPPAIALAIGAYLHVQYPHVSARVAAGGAYVTFMALNIAGVSIAAMFELVVTIAAIVELLVFMAVVAPGFSWANFAHDGWAGADTFSLHAIPGILAAVPFAIWFFLAIEGVAMTAEEARDPQRTIPMAYVAGIVTLMLLAFGVMVMAGGVGDWKVLANLNDPLPRAMLSVVGPRSGYVHMLVWLGLFGLVASFHGIIMGYSRQIYAMAREGYLPALLGRLHPRFGTPWAAILAGGIVGLGAVFGDRYATIGGQPLTASIVTMSVFGALTMYVLAMGSVLRLRRMQPGLHRPWRVPGYPVVPGFALVAALLSFLGMAASNPAAFVLYALVMGAGVGAYLLARRHKRHAAMEKDAGMD